MHHLVLAFSPQFASQITEMVMLTGVQPLEGRQGHDAGRKVQLHDKPSHENQAGRSHQEPAEKKQFRTREQEAEPTVSRQTALEHTPLLPTRHVRALGNGHN